MVSGSDSGFRRKTQSYKRLNPPKFHAVKRAKFCYRSNWAKAVVSCCFYKLMSRQMLRIGNSPLITYNKKLSGKQFVILPDGEHAWLIIKMFLVGNEMTSCRECSAEFFMVCTVDWSALYFFYGTPMFKVFLILLKYWGILGEILTISQDIAKLYFSYISYLYIL